MMAAAKEFTITLDDVEYSVIVGDKKIKINGRPFAVEVGEDGTVLVDGIAYDVAVEGDTAEVGGETHPLEVKGFSMRPSAADRTLEISVGGGAEAGAGMVTAIMPGQITRVMVEVGQEVKDGEAVCVLEAMKMENELRADRDGVVGAVHVTAGDDVEKDQVLVEIE